jgi:hypothetical protein
MKQGSSLKFDTYYLPFADFEKEKLKLPDSSTKRAKRVASGALDMCEPGDENRRFIE